MEEGGGGGAGGAKVRVVRCPKCYKLLPELPNLTVYRCGGCDTTLQAKAQISSSQASPQSSDCEKKKMGEVMAPDSSSEAVVECEKIESLRGDEPILPRNKSSLRDGASGSRSEEGSGADDGDGGRRRPSKAPAADISAAAIGEQVKRSLEGGRQTTTTTRYRDFSQKSAWRRDTERDRAAPALIRRPLRPTPMESSHLAPYPDEGPSNYIFNHAHRYAAAAADSDPSAKQRVDHLEQDRAELLRKLDELRDQLKRSCEVAAPQKERDPVGRALPVSSSFGDGRHNAWYPEGSSSLNQASAHRSHFLASQDASRLNLYPAMLPVNGIPGYRETLGRAPFHPASHYPQRPLNNYMYSQFDSDPFLSYHHDGFYRHDGFYHQPACSCLHCYNNQWLPPAHIPHPLYNSNQRVPYPNGTGFYPAEAPPMMGQQTYNQRATSSSLHPHEPQVQPRAFFAKKDARYCRPIAGAAPFIACHSCLKLLELPKHISLMEKKRRRLRCGSCSHVMLLEFDGVRLVASDPALAFPEASENNDISIDGRKEDSQSHDFIAQPVSSYSGDYASAGYDFNSTEEKLVLPSPSPVSSQEMLEREYGLNLSGSEKMQRLSFSSMASENLGSPYSMICQKDLPSSAELPLEDEATASRVASLPLREHFGFPQPAQVINSSGNGSRSKRSEQERILALDANLKQNSVKDVMVASEMDLSVDDYDNPSLSQDSWEGNRHEDEPRIVKGGESSFAGFIKKSFKDLSRSTENGRSKVSINGHPISDRIVKKAEKLAGPIHPGAYWYDYRAGFWGAMGHQCLGIIPPFIEEFNYPMPRNCAGGNTDVLVNGRELNQTDLGLLVGRGLPDFEGRSYIIEISGKVWDEASGEELDGLGKLAPTVEKVKHGFGMRIPRVGA